MPKNRTIAVLTAVIVTAAVIGITTSIEQASASHNVEPSMWVNGINAGQTHSYIYMVPPPTNNMDMSVALMIKDMEDKPNITFIATDPNGVATVCPIALGVAGGGPANLLHSECFFTPPAPGIWTFSIVAGPIMNNPVGYAIAADTVTVYPDGQYDAPGGAIDPGAR